MDIKNGDKNPGRDNNEKSSLKPDSETLHTKDPQKNMEGPVSSVTRKTGDIFETNETKQEADEERDKNM